MKPVISIIVPVYNAKDYIHQCIDSIVTQHGFDRAELILVDDGSKDVSGAVCDSYARRFDNVTALYQENSGVSEARNTGIKAAKGEYICFADADDFLFGGIVKKILDTVEKCGPDFMFFDYKYEYTDSYVQLDFPFESGVILSGDYVRKDIAEFMLSDSSFNAVWNKVFKKSLVDENGICFEKGKKYGEDKDFVLKFMQVCGNAFYIHETGYFYRYVESGAIQKARTDYFTGLYADYVSTLNLYKKLSVDKKTTEEKAKKFLGLKIFSNIEMAYKKCTKEVFSETLLSALKDEEFSSVLRELCGGDYFTDEKCAAAVKAFSDGKITAVRRIFKKDELRNRIYSLIAKPAGKEPVNPVFDNKDALEYPFKVTVFTPVYNRRRTIDRVFNSLVSQTYKDFEWLIIDDGSTDNLKELVDEYKEKADFLIRYYYKPNGGKHTAINYAYQLTDSEYFITVDSDDALLPGAIEGFLRLWEQVPEEKRESYWSVVGRCINHASGKMVGDMYPDGINESSNPEEEAGKISGDKFSCPRTEVLKKFPFPEPEGTTFITESVVWNRINRSYRQYYTNDVFLEVYTAEEDSLSYSWFKNHIKQGYVSNFFWMSSQLNESYEKRKLKTALKLGYYGYVSGKSLKEIRGSINSPLYKLVCTVEFPFLFVIKKLRYDKYSEN